MRGCFKTAHVLHLYWMSWNTGSKFHVEVTFQQNVAKLHSKATWQGSTASAFHVVTYRSHLAKYLAMLLSNATWHCYLAKYCESCECCFGGQISGHFPLKIPLKIASKSSFFRFHVKIHLELQIATIFRACVRSSGAFCTSLFADRSGVAASMFPRCGSCMRNTSVFFNWKL